MKNKKLFAILTLVCFMFTLMPVAAFAAVDAETSSFVAVDGNQSVKVDKEVKFDLALRDAAEEDATGDVLIWAETANGTVTSALVVENGVDDNNDGLWKYTAASADEVVTLTFIRSGEYTVYAAPYVAKTAVKDLNKFDCEFSVIKVKSAAADPEYYQASVDNGTTMVDANADEALATITVDPNNVQTDKIFVNFYDKDDKALKGETVTIATNSASIEVNKETDVTNSQGEIDFKVSASVEGTYKVILTVDGVDWVVLVNVGNTAATYIETETAPTAPLALYESFAGEVAFEVTDINGNIVACNNDKAKHAHGIWCTATGMGETLENGNAKYIVLTEKPADSDLESEDLDLAYNAEDQVWELVGVGTMDAEGTYAVKVILDNGAFATATWEVKKFQTPVMMYMELADVVELGKYVAPTAKYVDANGVTKVAKDADFAANGYAVSYLTDNGDGTAVIGAKTDEKYAGQSFTVTAVSERYNLVATKDVKIANEATTVKFVDTELEVNVNNKVEWFIADENGAKVRLNNADHESTKYIVLDKPEGAKVTVYDAAAIDNGEGKMSLTSNKVGNVAIQIVVQYSQDAISTSTENATQYKYYTATQIFAVGTKDKGDVVVMSVGSNEIVINDAKGTIDAAPIVENNRTFVPFRALAEAFGATVAFDEATQAVTAELNGVTVVMTIGSAEYTVNGVAKTADVAPFINGSRTMVPVRFAAEAFGIKVIPTYDENGATADILFNL